MNNKALKTLEYTKIIEMLAAHASSPLGKIRCECSPSAVPILPGKLQPQSMPSVLFPGKYTAWLFHYPLYHHPSVDV